MAIGARTVFCGTCAFSVSFPFILSFVLNAIGQGMSLQALHDMDLEHVVQQDEKH